MNDRTSTEGAAASRLPLGHCMLDLAAGELFTAEGELAGLRKQALDLLLVLGRRAGQVVSKDHLMSEVWPKVVVGEGSLTQAIADVRRVLGDDEHRLVRTVARRGYMLVPEGLAPAADAGALTSAGPIAAEAVHATAPRAVDATAAPSACTTTTSTTTPRAESAAAPAVAAGLQALQPSAPPPLRRAALLGAFALLVLLSFAAWLALRGGAIPWLSPADLARAPLPREVPPLSIIVLPLTQEGEAKEAEWLADALHGDLIVAVAKLGKSLVIARDTAATYKGKAVDPRNVAREMGVRHVVRGSLRREGTKVQLNVALIDGESGVQRWAETFAAERAQLAQTVGDFAVAIERTLVGELYRTTVERRAALSPAEVTADDLAMQGYALWYRGVSRENVLAARDLFERALVLDPDSPRGWAGIQFTTANQLLNGWTDDRAATLRRAEEAVSNLERVDRDGSPTYSAKTFKLYQQRQFQAVLQVTTEWVERYRLPLAFGAHGAALMVNGRFDEAVPVIERALRLGPRDPFRAEWQYRLALAHFGGARYELARDWSQSAAHTNARLVWPPIHAAALVQLGRREAAQQAFDEHMRRHPKFTTAQALSRVPGLEPGYAEMRTRLIASLRELGLRD
ncbi:MAG: winged helix-turn-helix domain-containing protein [Rubrivivax sp.]|nr:winged helix-turn-helix domain-containing protein [Rubrivivax sp.]